MAEAYWSGSLLVGRFADFYQDVALLKQAIEEQRLGLLLGGEHAAEASSHELAAMVSSRLVLRLQQQEKALRAEASSEVELRAYKMTQYVMVALADEIFILNLDWAARDHWASHLLEQSIFRSHQSGRSFFVLLGNLLQLRGGGHLQAELAAVFLLALQLGFKGEFRGRQGERVLADYRRRLLRFIAARQPGQHLVSDAFEQAYQHTLQGKEEQRLAPIKPWIKALVLAAGLYVLISTAIWLTAMAPLSQRLSELIGGA